MKSNSNLKKTKSESIKPNKINKRLLKDVANILKYPLNVEGIYYKHDETNAYKGYAMIIGPSESLYRYGYYFFNFEFPQEYPYSPPKVYYLTNDGSTRFNPNLYRNGKVCISILNTWKGEQWTSCQSIRSVLLTLLSLFHNKPLLNEPGITESNSNFKKYNQIIQHQNIKIAILKVIKKELMPPKFNSFWNNIVKNIFDNEKNIIEYLNKLKNEHSDEEIYCSIYNMHIDTHYSKLFDEFQLELKKIKETNDLD